ncbi:type VII secretion-associated serine protease mycosin [Streptomyces griseoloalbus]|uniref:Type VII secretion-associated serine protease mycosin n=1 Tax=Streptomyces griseoloalbus TaxID=67303 RepID=A0ABV3EGF2_9ACTN
MRSRSKRTRRPLSVASAALGLLLVGIAATPAHAESVRDMQWHLDAMRAEEMWKMSKGEGVTIAVIDSGVDDSLADLKGQVLDGKDYSGQRGDEHTDIGEHGTSMAALIAATGARGPQHGSYGLAPAAKILPIRMRYATENYGQVDNKAEYSRVLTRAIRYAADTDAQIINISMGSSDAPGRKNVGTPALASAVRYAIAKGKLIFAAVGNSGDKSNRPEYPASTPGVVGVGAADKNGNVLETSQSGPQVDLTAPGEDIINACLEGTQVCTGSGTSASTALASASAALIWAQHPDWTNHQVLRVMLNTAGKANSGAKRTDFIGYGIVRPRIALKNPGDPGPADEFPLPELAAAASEPPSAKTSPSAGAGGNDSVTDEASPATAASTDSDGLNSPWTALGAAAAALLAAAVAIPTLRARRRRPAPVPTAPPLPPPYSPYGPASQQPPAYGTPPGHIAPPPPGSGQDWDRRP